MNKNVLSLAFILTISFVYSSGNQYQNLLSQFVSLQEALGKENSDVVLLITQVKVGLKKSDKIAKAFSRQTKLSCKTAIAKLENKLRADQQKLTSATLRKAKWQKTLVLSKRRRANNAVEIKKARAHYRRLDKKLAKYVLRYRVAQSDAKEKLRKIREFKKALLKALVKKRGTAFVEIKGVQNTLSEIKSLFNSVQDNEHAPIVSALLQMESEKSHSPKKSFKKAIHLLILLEKSVLKAKKSKLASLDSGVKRVRNQKKIIGKRINILFRSRAHIKSTIKDAKHYIKFSIAEIQKLTHEIVRTKKEIENYKKICNYQIKCFKSVKYRSRLILKVTKKVAKKALKL